MSKVVAVSELTVGKMFAHERQADQAVARAQAARLRTAWSRGRSYLSDRRREAASTIPLRLGSALRRSAISAVAINILARCAGGHPSIARSVIRWVTVDIRQRTIAQLAAALTDGSPTHIAESQRGVMVALL